MSLVIRASEWVFHLLLTRNYCHRLVNRRTVSSWEPIFLPAPGVPSNDAYVKLYTKNVDEELANVGAMAYDAANVIMLGTKQAGTDSDLKKIADAIHSLDYTMVSGNCKVKLIPEGRIQRAGEFICRIQGGKMVDVSYFPFTPEILQADIDLYKNP